MPSEITDIIVVDDNQILQRDLGDIPRVWLYGPYSHWWFRRIMPGPGRRFSNFSEFGCTLQFLSGGLLDLTPLTSANPVSGMVRRLISILQ
jgi:hypothetical protein